jgi:hypothetical protein
MQHHCIKFLHNKISTASISYAYISKSALKIQRYNKMTDQSQFQRCGSIMHFKQNRYAAICSCRFGVVWENSSQMHSL